MLLSHLHLQQIQHEMVFSQDILNFVLNVARQLINKIMLLPILLFLFSCSTKADESYSWDTSVEKTDKESFIVENFIDGFEIPWGMCFLPNEDLLVSDRNGTLWQIKKDGKSKKKISGVPKVKYKGQGGLLDVQIHPNFIDNSYVYVCFSDFQSFN